MRRVIFFLTTLYLTLCASEKDTRKKLIVFNNEPDTIFMIDAVTVGFRETKEVALTLHQDFFIRQGFAEWPGSFAYSQRYRPLMLETCCIITSHITKSRQNKLIRISDFCIMKQD